MNTQKLLNAQLLNPLQLNPLQTNPQKDNHYQNSSGLQRAEPTRPTTTKPTRAIQHTPIKSIKSIKRILWSIITTITYCTLLAISAPALAEEQTPQPIKPLTTNTQINNYQIVTSELLTQYIHDWLVTENRLKDNVFVLKMTFEYKNGTHSLTLKRQELWNSLLKRIDFYLQTLLENYQPSDPELATISKLQIHLQTLSFAQLSPNLKFEIRAQAATYLNKLNYQIKMLQVDIEPITPSANLLNLEQLSVASTANQVITPKATEKSFDLTEIWSTHQQTIILALTLLLIVLIAIFVILRNKRQRTNKKSTPPTSKSSRINSINDEEFDIVNLQNDSNKLDQHDSQDPQNNAIGNNEILQEDAKYLSQLVNACANYPYFVRKLYELWQQDFSQQVKENNNQPYIGDKVAVLFHFLGENALRTSIHYLTPTNLGNIANKIKDLRYDLTIWKQARELVAQDIDKLTENLKSIDTSQSPFGFMLTMPDQFIVALLRDKAHHIQEIALAQLPPNRSQALVNLLIEPQNIKDFQTNTDYYRNLNSYFFQDVANFLSLCTVQALFEDSTLPITDEELQTQIGVSNPLDTRRALKDSQRQRRLSLYQDKELYDNTTNWQDDPNLNNPQNDSHTNHQNSDHTSRLHFNEFQRGHAVNDVNSDMMEANLFQSSNDSNTPNLIGTEQTSITTQSTEPQSNLQDFVIKPQQFDNEGFLATYMDGIKSLPTQTNNIGNIEETPTSNQSTSANPLPTALPTNTLPTNTPPTNTLSSNEAISSEYWQDDFNRQYQSTSPLANTTQEIAPKNSQLTHPSELPIPNNPMERQPALQPEQFDQFKPVNDVPPLPTNKPKFKNQFTDDEWFDFGNRKT